jgi:hypothetical protein
MKNILGFISKASDLLLQIIFVVLIFLSMFNVYTPSLDIMFTILCFIGGRVITVSQVQSREKGE